MGVVLAPVKAILDRIHPSLPTQRDQNSYTLGEMCGHNVVVAVLPEIGNNAAAMTAVQLMNDFPSIRFGLLVGIGGGVPDEKEGHDIRLGDVVVSKPTNSFGGVIQYDLGKETSSGFQRTGTLNKPPAVLLSAVEQLRATHMMEDSQTSHYLSQMIERYPKMKDHYSYPGTDHDQLFRSSYDHRGGTTCDDCDKGETVERAVRAHAGSSVHYGTIGSANKVIKNATERDKLKKEMKILCVEMEAAGLMDSFPCLVIRGICDYADSHKNKRWQPYAAAAAAAYMKELLVVIHPRNVAQISPVVEVVQSLAVQFAAESEERRQSDMEANFLKSLTDNNQPKRKHYIRPEHYGTFQWGFAEAEDRTPSDLTT
jgi:nucleoside phosphorylase